MLDSLLAVAQKDLKGLPPPWLLWKIRNTPYHRLLLKLLLQSSGLPVCHADSTFIPQLNLFNVLIGEPGALHYHQSPKGSVSILCSTLCLGTLSHSATTD